MDDKTAANILLKLREKYPLTKEEKEAIETAIGVLAWTTLAQSKIKNIRTRKQDPVS